MTDTQSTTRPRPDARTQPTERTCPFSPPEGYRTLREEAPITPVTFPDGTDGWLVSRHADVRTVLADPRFGANRRPARTGGSVPAGTPCRRPRRGCSS